MSLSKLGDLLKAKKIQPLQSKYAKQHYLDTGYPVLNEALTGDPKKGFPSGQIVMIAGPSACGKTAILSEMMISAQKQGGFAGIFDGETRYDEKFAESRGLSLGDNFQRWVPDTFEEAVSTAITTAKLIRENDMIAPDAPIVFGFDSLHSLTAQSKFDNMVGKNGTIEKGEKTSMHDQYAISRATSEWFPVMQREFVKYGVTAIFLNQVRRKTDHLGREYYTFPGGDAPYYYSATVLVLNALKVFEGTGADRTYIRNEISCLVDKSSNTIPHNKVKWDFAMRLEGGPQFDVIGSYTKHLQQIGAIETNGARVGWKGKAIYLSQVIDELRGETDAVDQLIAIDESFKKGEIVYPYPKKEKD